MTAAIDLRRAEDADVPGIVALLNRAYRGVGDDAGWNSERGYIEGDRTTEDLLRLDLAAKPHAFLLIWRDGADLTGSAWLEPIGEGAWYLGSLAVDPRRQDGGLGRALLSSAERWIRDRGGSRVRMTVVNVRESLIAWYLRRGYHLTGETEPFPYDDNRFGAPTRDDLGFVVLEKDIAPLEGMTS